MKFSRVPSGVALRGSGASTPVVILIAHVRVSAHAGVVEVAGEEHGLVVRELGLVLSMLFDDSKFLDAQVVLGIKLNMHSHTNELISCLRVFSHDDVATVAVRVAKITVTCNEQQ